MEFINDRSKLYQASIVYEKNELLAVSVLQWKKWLISVSNIVTNFTFKIKIGKVFAYTHIYNFVHTTELFKPYTGFKCFKTQYF